jgi:uncharacterized protein YbbC (DUF1343 family)
MFEQTGLLWSNPSPNLRSPHAALLYPAIGLLEGTNLSVGRGTDQPFMQLGAPFIDAKRLLAELDRDRLAGLRVRPTAFTPTSNPYAGKVCHGLHVEIADAQGFRPVRAGLEIARALRKLYPEQWEAQKMGELIGHAASMQALLDGAGVTSLEPLWRSELGKFSERRQRFLRYPACPAATNSVTASH